VHPWMNSWVVVSDTPFVGVTDATGSFTIPDVPPGAYTVSIWHETLGEQTAKVTVAEGQKATVSVSMAAK
jgi:ABC-type Zn2+ transport system substrate-binding protein/surface adhesin